MSRINRFDFNLCESMETYVCRFPRMQFSRRYRSEFYSDRTLKFFIGA